jgi:hypothetical protein
MRVHHIILLIGLCALAACAAGPAPRTGFLSTYDGLEQVRGSDSLLEQRPPLNFDPAAYHAVVIDPTDVQVPDLEESDRQQLADVFREALIERLDGKLPVVAEVGPGVIRVRTAIVGVRKANVPLNVVTSLLAAPLSRGGVAAEAEVLDGGSGKRIAALSWSRRGVAITQATLQYTRFGEARQGLRAFANRLADLFTMPGREPVRDR